MEQTPHFTKVFTTRTEKLISDTPFGMAHWSGTASDPAATCSTCVEFIPTKTGKAGRGHCAKWQRLTRLKKRIRFDGDTRACLHHRTREAEEIARSMDINRNPGTGNAGVSDDSVLSARRNTAELILLLDKIKHIASGRRCNESFAAPAAKATAARLMPRQHER